MKITYLFLLALNLFALSLFAIEPVERINQNIGLIKLTVQVYLLQTSYACNGNLDCNHLLILDRNDVVLVNTPARDSMTSVLLRVIETRFKKKVTRVIVSHFHDDSSGGLNITAWQ